MSFAMPTTFSVTGNGAILPVSPQLPHDWQYALPDAASPVMVEAAGLYHLVSYLAIAAFVLFVCVLMWVLLRYNRHLHPVARKTERNPLLQASWIGVSVIVLVLIAIPALKLLYFVNSTPKADLAIDVVGRVGAWTYEYSDDGDVRYDSHLLDAKTARAYRQPYPLAVDYPLEVPVGQTVVLNVTSADVIHSWSVPSLGVRVDAVPGHVNAVWFKATKEGLYYGMCSQRCGARSAFMPIAVKVVSPEEYRGWLTWAQGKFAAAGAPRFLAWIQPKEATR